MKKIGMFLVIVTAIFLSLADVQSGEKFKNPTIKIYHGEVGRLPGISFWSSESRVNILYSGMLPDKKAFFLTFYFGDPYAYPVLFELKEEIIWRTYKIEVVVITKEFIILRYLGTTTKN